MRWVLTGWAAAATIVLAGCYSDQSLALGSCKHGKVGVESCMRRAGYILDTAHPACVRVKRPERYADCYRPEEWFAALALRIEHVLHPPPEPPPIYLRHS